LDQSPNKSRYSVRTGLKNVIANAIVIWLKHEAGIDYHDKDIAYKAIHALDMLTPAPSFVPTLAELSASTSCRKRKVKERPTVIVELVYSDGDVASVKL
jgi:hypothetical protein